MIIWTKIWFWFSSAEEYSPQEILIFRNLRDRANANVQSSWIVTLFCFYVWSLKNQFVQPIWNMRTVSKTKYLPSSRHFNLCITGCVMPCHKLNSNQLLSWHTNYCPFGQLVVTCHKLNWAQRDVITVNRKRSAELKQVEMHMAGSFLQRS